MREGIDDEPTEITRNLLGEHCELICGMAKAIGVTRATIVRSIIDEWIRSHGMIVKKAIAKTKKKGRR